MKCHILIALIIAFIIGSGIGYLLGCLEETSKYAHALEDGHKWRDKCDEIKDSLNVFKIDMAVREAHNVRTWNDTIDSLEDNMGGRMNNNLNLNP